MTRPPGARRWLAIGLVATFLAVAALSFSATVLAPSPWRFLDWAIPYATGFVRRGLLGEIGLSLHDLLGLPINVFVFACHVLAYGVFLRCAHRVLARIDDLGPLLFLVCSPFLFLYPLADVIGGLRKEILLFALVAWLAARFAGGGPADPADPGWANARTRDVALALGALPLLVLSHEMLFLYAGHVLFFACLLPRSTPRLVLFGALFALSVAAFVAAATHSLPAADVPKVAETIAAAATRMPVAPSATEDGAIVWLVCGPEQGIAILRERAMPMIRSLPPVVVLASIAFLPAVLPLSAAARRHAALRSAMRWLGRCVLLSLLATAPLFVVAFDWGRFLYVHSVCVGLQLVCLHGLHAPRIDPADCVLSHRPVRRGAVSLLPLYALGWGIDHTACLVNPGVVLELANLLVGR